MVNVSIPLEDENNDAIGYIEKELKVGQVEDIILCARAVVRADSDGSSELFSLVDLLRDVLQEYGLVNSKEGE